MAGANSWRIPDGITGWMRNMEKRILAVERRPVVSAPADILGPGIAPHAVTITNWNEDAATFNGFYYSTINAAHPPDTAYGWVGQTIALADGYGIQRLYPVHDSSGALATGHGYLRRFFTPGGTYPRIYTTWEAQ